MSLPLHSLQPFWDNVHIYDSDRNVEKEEIESTNNSPCLSWVKV